MTDEHKDEDEQEFEDGDEDEQEFEDDDEEFDADDEFFDRGEADGHGFPVSGYQYGQPVPVLRLIPKERWREVMAPLGPAARRAAANSADSEDISVAMALVGELAIADGAGKAAALTSPPPAVPGATPGPHVCRGSRQINFRLGPTQYERLVQAAAIFRMRPTTLARVLTVSGVDRALYEERRARQEAFAPAPAPAPAWRASESGGLP
jgi:hypothetical protein